MTTSATSTHFSLELFGSFHLSPRKFLLHSFLYYPAQEHKFSIINHLHANAPILLLLLTCTIVSCLGLFCVSKCGIRGSTSVAADSGVIPSAKSANTGVEQNTLNAFPIVNYATELKLPSLDTACAICLSEFTAGEHLRILPKCNHGFHTRCVDTWLISHSSCPTCRHCLAKTDQKTNNCSQAESLPLQETINIQVN